MPQVKAITKSIETPPDVRAIERPPEGLAERQALLQPPAARPGWFRRHWPVVLVILLSSLLAIPRLTFLLPALADHRDEIYQPLRALKFAASAGQAFHKYGPAPNFVLLPAYGATFVYWKVTGDFSTPQQDYPYGLARPLDQLGVLIFESRLIFLLLGIAGVAALTAAMRRQTGSTLAAAGAALLMIVTCYRFQWALPSASVDASMIAFVLLALAAWLRMAHDGPTPWRGALFAAAAAMAVGSKENAAFPLAVMSVALVVWSAWRERTGQNGETGRLWRSVVTAALVGSGLYLALNVIYAPGVWWQRIEYWSGPGVSGGVWGENESWRLHLRFVGAGFLNNLGPAGVILVPLAITAAWFARPGWAALLSAAPLASVVTVLALPYATDRFITPALVTAAPLVAIGIAAAWERSGAAGRVVLGGVLALGIGANLLWSTVVYHLDDLAEQAQMERDLATRTDDPFVGYAVMIGDSPAMHRLNHLGYRADLRAMPEWAAERDNLPDVIYASAGRMQMIDEARQMPGRAAFYKSEYDFDLDAWPGFEALGYAPPRPIETPWPRRLALLEWMPLADELGLRTVIVYERAESADNEGTAGR